MSSDVTDFLLSTGIDAWLEDDLHLFVVREDVWGTIHWSCSRHEDEGVFQLPCTMGELWEHQPILVLNPCMGLSHSEYQHLSFGAHGTDTLGFLRVRLAP